MRIVVSSLKDIIALGLYLHNVDPVVLRQYCTEFLPVQCCLEPLGQHCTRFYQCNIVPRVSSGTTLHRKILMQYIVLEVLDNFAQEKILFNVVLILLGQHCIGKNPVLDCPRGCQHCIGILSSQCFVNIAQKVNCAMLAQSTQSSFYRKITCKTCYLWSGKKQFSGQSFNLSQFIWTTLHNIFTYSVLI